MLVLSGIIYLLILIFAEPITAVFNSENNVELQQILMVPMAFLLSALWKMTGVWLTCPITEFLIALLGFVIYKRKNTKRSSKL